MIMESRDDVNNSVYGNLLPALRRLSPAPACRAHCRAHLRPWNVIQPLALSAVAGGPWTLAATCAVNDNMLEVNEKVEIPNHFR